MPELSQELHRTQCHIQIGENASEGHKQNAKCKEVMMKKCTEDDLTKYASRMECNSPSFGQKILPQTPSEENMSVAQMNKFERQQPTNGRTGLTD